MFDLLAVGPFAFLGTILGFGAALFLHWYFPQLGDHVIFLDGVLIVGGFAFGLFLDFGREKR